MRRVSSGCQGRPTWSKSFRMLLTVERNLSLTGTGFLCKYLSFFVRICASESLNNVYITTNWHEDTVPVECLDTPTHCLVFLYLKVSFWQIFTLFNDSRSFIVIASHVKKHEVKRN